MIPKAPHFDSFAGEKLVSFFVPRPLVGKAVSAAVQFHCEPGGDAIKIEKVNPARILTAKFEIRKATVAQEPPETLLGGGGFSAEVAGEIFCRFSAGAADTPHPNPLPSEGRGNRSTSIFSVRCH